MEVFGILWGLERVVEMLGIGRVCFFCCFVRFFLLFFGWIIVFRWFVGRIWLCADMIFLVV